MQHRSAKMWNFRKDVASKLLDDSQYANARMVEDQEAWDETAQTIGTLWQEEVVAYAQ